MLAGSITYPGLPPTVYGVYTCSHGVTPGIILVRTQVGPVFPAPFGDVVITDGNGVVVIPGCKLEDFRHEKTGGGGEEWVITIADPRWRWRDLCIVHGSYNQLDPHGKLLPAFVRSPTELVLILLTAMGVTDALVDMPPGVSSLDVGVPPEFLPVGVNFPPVGVNPCVDWYAANPASELAKLCEQFGRRVVYDPVTNSVGVVRMGATSVLPPGSVAAYAPGVTLPGSPDGVMVVGDPTRYQTRLELAPYGEEWDGSYVPIDELSYAPRLEAKPAIYRVSLKDIKEGADYILYLAPPDKKPREAGAGQKYGYTRTAGAGETAATVLQDLRDQVNNSADDGVTGKVKAVFTAAAGGKPDFITVTGQQNDYSFDVTAHFLAVEQVQTARPEQKSWSLSPPPLFPGVRETDRLTGEQARALAQKSVFKCYRLTGRDVSGSGPILIPGYGPVARRQQVVISDVMCDQVVPDPGNNRFARPKVTIGGEATQLDPLTLDLYNGYSRDRAARVYGSVATHIIRGAGYIFVGNDLKDGANTSQDDVIPIDFSVDPFWQMVTFSAWVYRAGAGRIEYPRLRLECACRVRAADTNQFAAYQDTAVFRPGPVWHVVHRPDVQLNVVGFYSADDKLLATDILEADPIVRARYYLLGATLQFQLRPGDTTRYNGIVPVAMGSDVTQVTYEVVGGEGCQTTVSRNLEHDTNVLPYPARRRFENLQPAARIPVRPERVNPASPAKQ